eukprot:TRINITY_DN628_c0_g1_i2.p1 TRINITY_DN628_c0_g1~~TRINITY_DN628_c0_g1_i2.p1  ORF type:complete len:849 (-),score=361.53 TRINITY_DN628_c0_g1_i2:127-2673(-)
MNPEGIGTSGFGSFPPASQNHNNNSNGNSLKNSGGSLDDRSNGSLSEADLAKRKWDAWSEKEVETFFEGIRIYGVREFAKVAQHLASKTKEQVRHYYYRLLKKMNLCLQPFSATINKQDRDEVKKALMCWYHYRKREGSLTASPPKGSTAAKALGLALYDAISDKSHSHSHLAPGVSKDDHSPSLVSPQRVPTPFGPDSPLIQVGIDSILTNLATNAAAQHPNLINSILPSLIPNHSTAVPVPNPLLQNPAILIQSQIQNQIQTQLHNHPSPPNSNLPPPTTPPNPPPSLIDNNQPISNPSSIPNLNPSSINSINPNLLSNINPNPNIPNHNSSNIATHTPNNTPPTTFHMPYLPSNPNHHSAAQPSPFSYPNISNPNTNNLASNININSISHGINNSLLPNSLNINQNILPPNMNINMSSAIIPNSPNHSSSSPSSLMNNNSYPTLVTNGVGVINPNQGVVQQHNQGQIQGVGVGGVGVVVPTKVTLHLFPRNRGAEKVVAEAGHNPLLQLTSSSTKTLGKIVKYISDKWLGTPNSKTNESEQYSNLKYTVLLYNTKQEALSKPLNDGNNNGNNEGNEELDLSWDVNSEETTGKIWSLLGKRNPVELWYSWPSIQLQSHETLPLHDDDIITHNDDNTNNNINDANDNTNDNNNNVLEEMTEMEREQKEMERTLAEQLRQEQYQKQKEEEYAQKLLENQEEQEAIKKEKEEGEECINYYKQFSSVEKTRKCGGRGRKRKFMEEIGEGRDEVSMMGGGEEEEEQEEEEERRKRIRREETEDEEEEEEEEEEGGGEREEREEGKEVEEEVDVFAGLDENEEKAPVSTGFLNLGALLEEGVRKEEEGGGDK